MSDLMERVVLPVADPDDAAGTCTALADYEADSVLAVHVIEKAGGAPDKASVEQRQAYADEIFAVVEDRLDGSVALETDVAYGTDVADAILRVAKEWGATAIVVTPRGGSRWLKLVTGDVALSLVTDTDRPVVVLPDDREEGAADGTDEADVTDDTDRTDAGDWTSGDDTDGTEPGGSDGG